MATPIISPPIRQKVRIAYRGDTRDPEEIFRDGFMRRPDAINEDLFKNIVLHPEITASRHRHAFVEPQYRNQSYMTNIGSTDAPKFDINPYSAICLTKIAALAPIFPIQTHSAHKQSVWIYGVLLEEYYKTYELQRIDHPELATAKEIAVKDVPSFDVVGAIQCIRYGGPYPSKIKYNTLQGIQWNPLMRHPDLKLTIEQTFQPHINRLTVIEVKGQAIGYEIRPEAEVMYKSGNTWEYLPEFPSREEYELAYRQGFRSLTTDDLPRDPYEGDGPRQPRDNGGKFREI